MIVGGSRSEIFSEQGISKCSPKDTIKAGLSPEGVMLGGS